jgi:hypothetical protein
VNAVITLISTPSVLFNFSKNDAPDMSFLTNCEYIPFGHK